MFFFICMIISPKRNAVAIACVLLLFLSQYFIQLTLQIQSIHILGNSKAVLSQDLSQCRKSKVIPTGAGGTQHRLWAQWGDFPLCIYRKGLSCPFRSAEVENVSSWNAVYHLKCTFSRSLFMGDESAMWPRQKQVLHCVLHRLKCEWRMEVWGETLRFLRMPRAFIVWSLSEQRTQSCSSQWFSMKYHGFSAVDFWIVFLSDIVQLKKRRKRNCFWKNTETDVYPCMYYLFYIITVLTFLNHLYPGKVTNLSEHACFFTTAQIHTHSHLNPEKLSSWRRKLGV